MQSTVARLARRLRTQTAADWASTSFLISAFAVVLITAAVKLWWIESAWITYSLWTWISLVALAAILPIFRRYDSIQLAARLDRTHGLHDRISTALDLRQRTSTRSAFETAQIQDAAQYLPDLDLTLAAPWRPPRALRWAWVPVLLFFLLYTLEPTDPPSKASTTAATQTTQRDQSAPNAGSDETSNMEPASDAEEQGPPERDVPKSEESPTGAEVAKTADADPQLELELSDALAEGDREAKKVLEGLRDSLNMLNASPDSADPNAMSDSVYAAEKAVEELAGTPQKQVQEAALEEKLAEVAAKIDKAAKKYTKDAKTEDELRAFSKALDARDYDAAARALERLLERFPKLSLRDQRRLAKTFEALGKKLESQLERERRRLKRDRDRLRKKERERGALSKRERSRLNRAEKQLERLDRQRDAAEPEHKKQLDRLSRELQDIAQQMRREREEQQRKQRGQRPKDRPEQRKNRIDKRSAKELSKMLRRMAKRRRQRRAGQKMKMKMADMKELLQRRRRQMRRGRQELKRRALGGGSKKDGPGKAERMEPSDDDRSGQEQLMRQKVEGRRQWSKRRNDRGGGAGRTRGQMLSGKETELEGAKSLEDFIPGKEGKGSSTREIIYGAAKAGPRVKGYGEAHIDFSMRASRQMEEEKIPAGYRESVERYFRLIRKR